MERTGFGGWIFVVTAVLMALSHPAGRAAAAGIAVVAPREGSTLTEPAIRIAGKVDGGTTVAFSVNGTAGSPVSARGGRFSLPVTLRPGRNRISLQSSGARLDLTLEYSAGAGGGYRFHDVYEDCAGCHDGLSGGEGWRNSGLCHSCHDRKDTARLLHGPVAAGQCTFCHDPHGSPYPSLTSSPGRDLCVACHDQPGSMDHLESGSTASCEKCHNPHGSEKKFFLR